MQALAALRGRVLRPGVVEDETQACIIKALIYSRLFHNTVAWGQPTEAAPALRRVCHAAAGTKTINGRPTHSDDEHRRRFGMPELEVVLRQGRLRLAGRVARIGTNELKFIVDAEAGSAQRVLQGCSWLQSLGLCAGMPDPHGGRICYVCGDLFISIWALASHMRHAHDAQGRSHEAAHGVACVACLGMHHTRARLRQHLRQTEHCREMTLTRVSPPTEEQVGQDLKAKRERLAGLR